MTIHNKLVDALILAYPDFTWEFHIYIDGSFEWGFSVVVHQTDNKDVEQPVLFLLRALSIIEQNYGAIELECAALIWMLLKLL